jgi:hypothetical protein
MRWWWITLLLLSACRPESVIDEGDTSTWGDVITLATAEQSDAPALHAAQDRVTLSWIGADDSGVHQDIRAIGNQRLSQTVVLPLPPTFPRNSRLFTATRDPRLHLLWLDVDDDGTSQLHSALIDETMSVFRGQLQVSESGARCFDAFSLADGQLWAVWANTDFQTPVLYSANIEQTGLVLRVQEMAPVSACPVAVQTASSNFVLWQDTDGLMLARFLNGRLETSRRIADVPLLGEGDQMMSFRAGADAEWIYAFWNITRADGSDETWFTAGQLVSDLWESPILLQLTIDADISYTTTYNSGQTWAAQPDDEGLRAAWAAPLPGVTSILPVAIYTENVEQPGGAIGVVYFEDGRVAGYQWVVDVRGLLRAPRLTTDRDRHLYLAWSEPTDTGPAQIRLTATRRLLPD